MDGERLSTPAESRWRIRTGGGAEPGSAQYGAAGWLVLTFSGFSPFFINIQTYFPGSIRPVPRSPGTSQFWSMWKKSASHIREKICVGSLFASKSLGIRYELTSYSKAGWVRSRTSHRTVRGALAQGLTGDGMTPGCSLCCCWHCDWSIRTMETRAASGAASGIVQAAANASIRQAGDTCCGVADKGGVRT